LFFTLLVALAVVLAEIMWILNVLCVEQFTELGVKCGWFNVLFGETEIILCTL
jgi:hypothetical protein